MIFKSSFEHSAVERELRQTSDWTLLRMAPCPVLMVKNYHDWQHRRVLAAVLTGVGEDGLAGSIAIRSSGGYTLAQDAATSTVFDQPNSLISAGEADEVLPLDGIARRITEISRR